MYESRTRSIVLTLDSDDDMGVDDGQGDSVFAECECGHEETMAIDDEV